MNKGISLDEIRLFFDALKQSKKNNGTQILIDNDMCKELQNMIEAVFIKQKKQDKEIERLNNVIDELEEELKIGINRWEKMSKTHKEEGWRRLVYIDMLNKLKELKEEGK